MYLSLNMQLNGFITQSHKLRANVPICLILCLGTYRTLATQSEQVYWDFLQDTLNSGIAHNSPLILLSGIRAALSTYLTVNWRLGDYSLTTIPKHFYGFPKQTKKSCFPLLYTPRFAHHSLAIQKLSFHIESFIRIAVVCLGISSLR